MDQKAWREIENRCTQEEAPPCSARCPIHVDARSFLREAGAGRWDEALQVLAAVMPFPRLLALICDHPCEEACKRREAGGPLSIGELERTAVRRGKFARRPAPLQKKTQRVGVVESGLSSLTVAFDLARKGYGVALLEPGERLGGNLREMPECLLPREIIEEEAAVLKELQVDVILSTGLDQTWSPDELRSRFDAVYLGFDGGVALLAHLAETLCPDPSTAATNRQGVFVGGVNPEGQRYSPVSAVAEGRRAAISIDRFLQRVSLTAARDREGPYESRLHVSLEGVESRAAAPVKDPEGGYTEEEARAEAGRCIQCECMECVKQCIFLERFKGYPKRHIRQVSNDATMVLGARGPTRKLVNSCSLCDLCTVLCPNDIPMARVCMEGRKNLVEKEKMPLSAHDFALEDMASANSAKAALVCPEPGKEASRFLFFPGCQLAGIYPEHVLSVYAHLRSHLQGGVGLMVRCCGVPAKWAARDALFKEALERVEQDWKSLGRPTMIVACPTCYRTFKEGLPGVDLVSLWETLAETADRWAVAAPGSGRKVAVHDACTARHEKSMQEAVRFLLKKTGRIVEELPLSGGATECCGYGGLLSTANPPLGKEAARRRAASSASDFVAYCAMCRNALAAEGKRISHVLDFLFASAEEEPAARKACGWSERRENRYRLKKNLIGMLGKESERSLEEYERILLQVSDDVSRRLEERRILREDVQKAIHHAEAQGERFIDPGTGRSLASFRPAQVTYWVEYSREGGAFRVHNAYSHRMEVVTTSRSG